MRNEDNQSSDKKLDYETIRLRLLEMFMKFSIAYHKINPTNFMYNISSVA